MSDKQTVVEQARAAYQQFMEAVKGLDEAALSKPFLDDWSVREIGGHLIGWLEQMTTGLERMARGERPSPEGVDWSDVQSWNNRFASSVAGRGVKELVNDLESRLERLIAAVQALPEDRFGENKTVNRMVDAAAIHHFKEHAEEIGAARGSGKL